MRSLRTSWLPLLLGLISGYLFLSGFIGSGKKAQASKDETNEWQGPDINLLPNTEEGNMIRYGRELIANTSTYLGPKGRVMQVSNGMNCQNCHVESGTRAFGNALAIAAKTYPKFRPRSGKIESLEFRINECMERSLNGQALDSQSKEMKAMKAYLLWIGKGLKPGMTLAGFTTIELPYLTRAADQVAGKQIFETQCVRCHGFDGSGLMLPDSSGYLYPPLWGLGSYNTSAGLYRISRLAAFIKYNMPFNPVQTPPQLSDEDAWDLAAYISSQPRPEKKFSYDWPKLETKPPDFPFGPYADAFSEKQHKYGPFTPIKEAAKKL
ncbi:MAG TPA: c-type cytochrome [Chitinophagaceae bacterium]|nr:c-type cytochrome [Chitinophagaceae bacterium]